MTSQSNSKPLAQVLQGIGSEIAAARDLAVRVEQVIEVLGRHATAAEMAECQAADLLTQSLTGLGLYVEKLAASAGHAPLDIGPASACVLLSDQQRRLLGQAEASADEAGLFWFEDGP